MHGSVVVHIHLRLPDVVVVHVRVLSHGEINGNWADAGVMQSLHICWLDHIHHAVW